MSLDDSRGYVVHSSRNKRAGKGIALVFVVLLVGIPAGLYWFWTDTEGLIRHVAQKDALASSAAFVLSVQGAPEEARDALLEGVADDDGGLRRACVRALGTYEDPSLLQLFTELVLADEGPLVRAAAIRAIGRTGQLTWHSKKAIEACLTDTEPKVVQATLDTTAELGYRDVVPTVIEKLDAVDLDTQSHARRCLEAMADDDAQRGNDKRAWLEWYNGG